MVEASDETLPSARRSRRRQSETGRADAGRDSRRPAADPELQLQRKPTDWRKFLSVLGPGLITGASDDDPSGIGTYSLAGAQFGYGLNWLMLITLPLMAAVQTISARIGRTTGRGLVRNLKAHASPWLVKVIVLALLLANTINIAADLAAMGDSVRLVIGGPLWVYVTAFGVGSALLQVLVRYSRYVLLLRWLSLSLFAYIGTLFMVHVDWREAGKRLLIPDFALSANSLFVIVAVLGTTISPYLLFWQAAQEVEDIEQTPRRTALTAAPQQSPGAFRRIGTDTVAGMAFSNVVALAIMMTAAATLHANGRHDINTSADAAEALRPIAGEYAFLLFALGIVGTGLLAVPVLAGSAGYALGEAMRWKTGLAYEWFEARAFYGAIVAATLGGIAVNLTPIDPIRALFWSAVVNCIIAVPVMVVMMRLAGSRKVMGEFAVGGVLRALGWLATAVMGAAAAAMIAGFFFDN